MVSVITLTSSSLSSATEVSIAWETMTQRTEDRKRTELALIEADISGGGTNIDISVRNTGQTYLADYSKWDVIIRYFATGGNADPQLEWLTYTSGAPADGQWTVEGIYTDATALTPEVFEPNVFNPGEEMIVRLNITPAIPAGTDNLATLGVANGTTLSAPFSR